MAKATAEIEIIGDSRGVERATFNARRALRSLTASIRDAAKMAASFAGGMAIYEGVASTFEFVKDAAIGMNATLEQARIGFTTMLGSARKADRFLRELADFAAKTPFEFPDLLEATRRMMAFGFAAEDVIPIMRAVGDTAAAMGLGAEGIDRITLALGQMRARAKVSAEEMLQLVEAGVPAWEILAEGIGVSTAELQKMVSKGLVPADKAIKILVEGMEKRFPGMMDKQSRSWAGLVSSIIDNARLLIAEAFEPMFNTIRDRFLKPLSDAIEAARSGIGKGLREAVSRFFDTLGRVNTVWELQRALDAAGVSGRRFFGEMKAWSREVRDNAPNLFDRIAQNIREGDWEGLANDLVTALIDVVKKAAARAKEFTRPILEFLRGIDWYNIGTQAWSLLLQLIRGMWDGVKAALKTWGKERGKDFLRFMFHGTDTPDMQKLVLQTIRGTTEPAIRQVKGDMRVHGQEFSRQIAAGIRAGGGQVGSATSSVASRGINDPLARERPRAQQHGTAIAARVAAGIYAGQGQVHTATTQVRQRGVDRPLSQGRGPAKSSGQNTILGFIQGLWSKVGSLYATVRDIINRYVVQPIRRALESYSPSRLMMDIGRSVAEGLALGMVRNVGMVARASQRLAAAVAMPALGLPQVPSMALAGAAMPAATGRRIVAQVDSGRIAAAVELAMNRAVRRISDRPLYVVMDGKVVGRIVTPYVEREMGTNWALGSRAAGLGVSVLR